MSSNKTIAKNTLFLYVRMMFTMLVALYTSRVILHVLGIDDYGIYQTVGGVVLLLSFLNGALSAGSSRFLTYELGSQKGNMNNVFPMNWAKEILTNYRRHSPRFYLFISF